MTELRITRGAPGSGKSYFALNWVNMDTTKRARVNRDDLRQTLFGLDYPLHSDPKIAYKRENLVTAVQRQAVRELLNDGVSVIVDDTHIQLKYVTQWEELADELGANFSVEDFRHVDVNTCQKNVDKRVAEGGRSVPSDVIKDIHERLKSSPKWVPSTKSFNYVYVPNLTLPKAFIFDIDGTLAHMNDKRGPFEWHKIGLDDPDEALMIVANALWQFGEYIVVLSGRDSVCRNETIAWLHTHKIPFNELYMRPEGDNRKDSIVKLELFHEYVTPRYNVQAVFDDRKQVVDLWRKIGLPCYQVAPGDF